MQMAMLEIISPFLGKNVAVLRPNVSFIVFPQMTKPITSGSNK
jgi:hypothetical protein